MAHQDKQKRKQGNVPEQIDNTKVQRNQDPASNPDSDTQDQFGNQGVDVSYSYRGVHEATEGGDEDQDDSPDASDDPTNNTDKSADAFAQDQFGDLDDNNEYTNLDDTEPAKTNADVDPDPDSLYGLEEPLAEPGADNRELRNKDRAGTPISMDQEGYQQ